MYGLKKKLERYLRVNLLGPGPRLMKKNLPGHGLTKVEKHWSIAFSQWLEKESFKFYPKCLSLMCFEVVLRP
jgi:hypothetical protein